MFNKLVFGIFLLFLTFSGAVEILARQKDDRTSAPDPVEKALSSGTDHLPVGESDQSLALQRRNPRYHVENGDVLDLQFQFTPDYNQTVTVQPDGYVTLKEVGDLHVEGESLPEVRHTLETAYVKILAKPVITVDLKDFEKPYFLVLGQVARPGKYDLRGITTVSAAVAMAGGFTSQAKHSQVLLFRRVNDNWSSVSKIDLKHMLNSRNLSEDASLRPGDMLYIPQNLISKVKQFVPTPTLGAYQTIP